MKTPDITPAQIISAIGAIVAVLVSATFVDNNVAKVITGVAGIIVPLAWIVGDAIIRHGRSQIEAARIMRSAPPVRNN